MNPVTKYYQRRQLTLLLIILLIISVTFSCIGISSFLTLLNQLKNIDSYYTTIAVPMGLKRENIDVKVGGLFFALDAEDIQGSLDKDLVKKDVNGVVISYSQQSLLEAALDAPQVLASERSGFLSAHLLNSKGISSGSYNRAQYVEAFDGYTHSMCVLAVECVSANKGEMYGIPRGTVSFRILDCVSMMDSYCPEELIGQVISFDANNMVWTFDGELLFEEGKTYIIRGFYKDYTAVRSEPEIDENGLASMKYLYMDMQPNNFKFTTDVLNNCTSYKTSDDSQSIVYFPGLKNFTIQRGDGNFYCSPDDILPYFAEYEGDVWDFIESDAGKVWKDTIIPMAELNQNSCGVVFTDNLNNLYNFNTGRASVIEGRAFTEQEYKDGSDVCLVSVAFAVQNGLNIGDTLEFDFYDTVVVQSEAAVTYEFAQAIGSVYQVLPLTEEARIGVTKSYEVIGIYSAPEWDIGSQDFCAETIFVPKNSMENVAQYTEYSIPFLNTVTIENGSEAEFEAYMAAQSRVNDVLEHTFFSMLELDEAGIEQFKTDNTMAGKFIYFNQNYDATLMSNEAMFENASYLLTISSVVFFIAMLIYYIVLMNKLHPIIRSMRLLGVSKLSVFGKIQLTFISVDIFVVAVGSILSALIFGYVSNTIFERTFELALDTMMFTAVIQILCLIVVGGFFSAFTANRNLMSKK
ncbi:MAG: hypothetical protein IJE40_05475 [Clostridia bacterium]|nr:hypothetical protein [Clostridia bacterium]